MSPTAHRTGLGAHGVLQRWVGLLLPPRARSGEHHVMDPTPWSKQPPGPNSKCSACITALRFGWVVRKRDGKVCPVVWACLIFSSLLKVPFLVGPSSAASFFPSALGHGHLCLGGGCSQRVSFLVLAVLRDGPQVLWGLAMNVIFHMTLSNIPIFLCILVMRIMQFLLTAAKGSDVRLVKL